MREWLQKLCDVVNGPESGDPDGWHSPYAAEATKALMAVHNVVPSDNAADLLGLLIDRHEALRKAAATVLSSGPDYQEHAEALDALRRAMEGEP
jgi:hypothetical protein